jgi:hypothetical protein
MEQTMSIDLIQERAKYDNDEFTAAEYAKEIYKKLQELAKKINDSYLQKLMEWFDCLNCENVDIPEDELLDGALEELYEWAVLENITILENE